MALLRDLLGLAVCGALGSLCRFGAGSLMQRATGSSVVWGTLLVNVVGCFLMGILSAVAHDPLDAPHKHLRLLLGVGFLGGFTTFSAFGNETVALLEEQRFAAAGGNVLGNLLLGFVAVWLGLLLGRWWQPAN